jgi:probable HAF family extracellular repeat protein
VVGASCDDQGNCRAFLWQNKQMVDLNSLIAADSPVYLTFAESINDAGQIVGTAIDNATGEMRAFLATPGRAAAATANFEPEELQVTTPRRIPESARKLLRGRPWMGFR